MYICVFISNTIPNSQKVETTQMLVEESMDKEIMVYTYNQILFSPKKADKG
jgi:predicted PolB exonuclease-like 3'-5' exonuclease